MTDTVDLGVRLRRHPATSDLVREGPFDVYDEVRVAAVAKRLLARFYAVGLPRDLRDDAFTLLLQVTSPLLDVEVDDVRRCWGVRAPNGEFLDVLYAGLYTRSGPVRVRPDHFLDDARCWLAHTARDAANVLGGDPLTVRLASLVENEPPGAHDAEAAHEELLRTRAFHALDLSDRRVILYRIFDGLSEAETAELVGIPLEEVEPRCDAALRRLYHDDPA